VPLRSGHGDVKWIKADSTSKTKTLKKQMFKPQVSEVFISYSSTYVQTESIFNKLQARLILGPFRYEPNEPAMKTD
jgi:hypothetical protein